MSMNNPLLIKNARAVNEGSISETDLLLRGGRIERIESNISAESSMDVLDAGGAWLLPGMIDDPT